MPFIPFTSVTRWLLVVIGCACLATAQPMSAALASDVPPSDARKNDTIIYPKNTGEPTGSEVKTADRGFSLVVVAVLLMAAAGTWVYIQKRKVGPIAPGSKKLQIEETRPLGNRQYLVVATYDGKKMLLGVTPGQIQMLTELENRSPEKLT